MNILVNSCCYILIKVTFYFNSNFYDKYGESDSNYFLI